MMKIESDPIVFALLAACGGAGSGDRVILDVAVELSRRPQVVEVRGLEPAAIRRLERLAPNDTSWTRVMAVYVERGAGDSASTPPVIGRYVPSSDRVRFEPRFPFAEGVAYRVEVDTAALAHGGATTPSNTTRAALLTHRFSLPTVARGRTTRVTGVYPSAERLPSNLLRWYVETSAPMDPGHALEHVHLMDESGREVAGAFLALDQELWDPERRRLTLLFDPGRVKRGVRTNVESGAPLSAGRRYRLVIDDTWVDGNGARLASGFEHAFESIGADRRSPDPASWHLTIPAAGSRAPLQVSFGEPLDHALAARLLTVLDARGTVVTGSVELSANDSRWMFTPRQEWTSGDFTLRVRGALEDLAGNNIARVFDVDRWRDSAGVDRDVAGATRTVQFRVVGP